jgi:hypothetical protein
MNPDVAVLSPSHVIGLQQGYVMSRYSRTWVLVAVLCMAGLDDAWAGAWLQDKGHYYSATRLGNLVSTSFWDRSGVRQPSPCKYSKDELGQYLEWGHSDQYTLSINSHLTAVSCANAHSKGLNDIELGIRGRLRQTIDSQSWQLTVIIPAGYNNATPTRLGYGRFGLDIGVARGDIPAANSILEYGLNLRWWQGPPANEMRGLLRWSHTQRRWTVMGELRTNLAWGDATPENFSLLSYDMLPRHDSWTAAVGLQRLLPQGWRIAAALERDLRGNNTGQGRSIYIELIRAWHSLR